MYKAIVIGASIGGINVMSILLNDIPVDFSVPIIVVQHISDDRKSGLAKYYNKQFDICVVEAQEKQKILSAHAYITPPDYHLLIEDDFTFTLDNGEYFRYARPSVDFLFQSAAYVYKDKLIAILLTGSNYDGGEGMKTVKNNGGHTIVQDILSSDMIEYVMKLTQIDNMVNYLKKITS